MGVQRTTAEFIHSAFLKHNGRYTYDNVVYICSTNKVVITCEEHGDFPQTPNDHLKGSGCLECANLIRNISNMVHNEYARTTAANKFIARATIIHEGKFSYEECEYKTSSDYPL